MVCHVIDKMIYDMMDTFDGANDEAVVAALKDAYPEADLREALGELHELMEMGELFAPDIDVPPTFKQKGLIKSICLMVAQDCNLRCKYCFGDGGSYGQERAVMTPEVGKRAIDFLIESCGLRKHCEVDFFGGEPLMNMKTVKAVTEYARQREKETGKKFKLTMTTNGMLLNDESIKWLNDNDFSLVLSLDSQQEIAMPCARMGDHGTYDHRQELQEVHREPQGRRLGLPRRLHVSARHLHPQQHGLHEGRPLDGRRGLQHPLGRAGRHEGQPAQKAHGGRPAAAHPAEGDRMTEATIKRHREGRGFWFFHFNMDLSNGPCVAKRLSGCGAGHEYVAVAENGDLYPCHQFVGREGYKLGDIYEGITNTELPQYFRESHVLNKEKCRDCWARFFCSGGCHANADLFHGDIRKPYEVGCEIQKKHYSGAPSSCRHCWPSRRWRKRSRRLRMGNDISLKY